LNGTLNIQIPHSTSLNFTYFTALAKAIAEGGVPGDGSDTQRSAEGTEGFAGRGTFMRPGIRKYGASRI
jgi:hypothetical protein